MSAKTQYNPLVKQEEREKLIVAAWELNEYIPEAKSDSLSVAHNNPQPQYSEGKCERVYLVALKARERKLKIPALRRGSPISNQDQLINSKYANKSARAQALRSAIKIN